MWMSILALVVSSTSLILNAVLLCGYLTCKTLRNNRSNRHVVNVLISQVFIAIAITVRNAGILIGFYVQDQSAMLFGNLAFQSFLLNMSLLSVERFVCVLYPLYYQQMAKPVQWTMLLVAWLYAIAMLAVKKFFVLQGFDAFLLICVTIILSVVANTLIFRVVLKQRKNFQQQTNNGAVNGERGNVRLSYACFGSVVSLVVLTLPVVVSESVNGPHTTILIAIGNLNSICDPLCFLYFNSQLQKQTKKLLSCCP